jgi:predicted ATPase
MAPAESPTTFANFVGRKFELAELKAALDDSCAGRGRMCLVSGEPGIGKTRLAEEIAREASARGMRALWGRCWEGDGAPAYWPWIQVIRGCVSAADQSKRRSILESEQSLSIVETVAQIVPELRVTAPHPMKPPLTSSDPEQARFQLFDALTNLLKSFARLGPLAIVIDDLHDAGDASLLMLRFIARELKGTSILIVGTYRELEVRRSPELSKHIGDN